MRPWLRPVLFALSCAMLAASGTARAQDAERTPDEPDYDTSDWDDRPTSGAMSLFSGRTMGNGQQSLAAAVGFPGFWAGLFLSPSSVVSLGIRAHVYYGTPMMGIDTGAGGGLTVPVRIHLFGKESFDIALLLQAEGAVGEGRLFGQIGVYGGSFGFGAQAKAGLLAGAQLSDAFTLSFGAIGAFGFVSTPANGMTGTSLLGGITGQVAAEGLMTRDMMLFATAEGGVGFADSRLFNTQGILLVSLGIAYLL